MEEDGAIDDDADNADDTDDNGALGLHLDAAVRPAPAKTVVRTEVIFIFSRRS